MLLFGAVLLGGIAYKSMRVELNPEVTFPTVTITTLYPGAGPEEINTLVSKKVEDSVAGVANLRELTSSSQEGFSVVQANFEQGTNVDVALNDVRTKVDSIKSQLPDGTKTPTISKFDNSASPVLNLAFASSVRNSRDLRDLIDQTLKDRFGQIKGAANISVQGGDVREIQVQLKKDRLLAYGLGIADVTRQIGASTQNVPGGRITKGDEEFSVRMKGQWATVDDIRNSRITIQDPNNQQGSSRSVRLADIATVEDTVAERTAYSRLDGKDTVILAIQKSREGNAVEITHAADKVIEGIKKEFPDIKITKTLQQAKEIENSLEDLNFTLYFAIFLVSLTVFLFLHNMRGTIIVAIAIPACIFVGFIAMSLAGFTVNNLTMLALILAIGVLVDDAIVVIENIYRHLKMGEDPREAALNGRGEIGVAAIAITMADVVVFLPIGFMGGIVGQFFKPMALTYVFAVVVSLFVSFTLTPMLAARWYKAGEDMEHPKDAFARAFEAGFARLEHGYRNILEWSLNHRWFVFILGNSALIAVFMFIGGGFVGLGGKPLDAAKNGIPLLAISVGLGIITYVVNWLRNNNNPRQGTMYVLGAIAASIPLVAIASSKAPAPPAMLGIMFSTVILFIAFIVMDLTRKAKRSKLYYVAAGLLFGLLFPAAAVLGGFYGQWKQSAPFKFEFIPSSDNAQVSISIKLPAGSSLEATQRVVEHIEQIVQKNENVEYVQSNIGTQSVGTFSRAGNQGSNYASISASLYDKGAPLDKVKGSKSRLRWVSDKSVAADITQAIGRVAGAEVKVSAVNAQGFGAPIQISLRGEDANELALTAEKIKNRLADGAIKGVINPDISTTPGKPELQVIPDRERLADAGLTVSDAGSTLRTLYNGDDTTKFREKGEEYSVRVQLSPEDRDDPDILRTVPVSFKRGNPIFLQQVGTITQQPAVDKIERRDREQEIRVTADLLPGYASGTVQGEIDKYIVDQKLIPEGIITKPLGQTDAQNRESGFLIGAFFLGLILVYMLLASLYDNLLYPFIIQLAQPQAITGAILALVLTDKPFSLIGFIGIVTLIGLVGKNAILLVDYTNTLRERGRNRHDALVEAGPTRLRPIAMTTIALVLGTLPIALALGRGSEFRETIGIIVIGGMVLSTILTLVVIPCSYTIFDDLSLLLGRAFSRGKKVEPKAPDLIGGQPFEAVEPQSADR